MRVSSLILLSLLFVACGPTADQDGFGQVEQAWSGPPKPPLTCDYPMVNCGEKCVNIQNDNRNCGWCENICKVSDGEFCNDYACVSVRNFGFNIYPQGPRAYDVRRDLPRPNPVQSYE